MASRREGTTTKPQEFPLPQATSFRNNHTIAAVTNSYSPPSVVLLSDNPCWGGPEECSLSHLLTVVTRSELILYESPDYLVLNKPADLRMDGPYAATVYKLLTYWYPPPSLQALSQEELLHHVTHHVHQSKDVHDFALRPCHQLDYATSGVLLVARNSAAAAMASSSFEKRTVQKVYMALVHGHLLVDDVLRKYTGRGQENSTISQQYLDDFMKKIERSYQRSRQRKNRKPQNTFVGYLPASAVFQKWKALMSRQSQHNESQQENASKRARTNPTSRISLEDWNQIWKSTIDLLTEVEQQHLQSLDWKQVKENAKWKDVFTKASDLYNEQIRMATADTIPEPLQVATPTPNDNTLPTVFRVAEDVDNLNRFYIFAATAEVPDQFAVQVSEEARLFLSNTSAATDSPFIFHQRSTSIQDELASGSCGLDFKPSLTQCTVVDHAFLEISGTRHPVTKVRLEPKTGRRHQLRVHMAHVLGTPIVHDITYAATSRTNAPELSSRQDKTASATSNKEEVNSLPTSHLSVDGTNRRGDHVGDRRCLRMCLHAQALEISLLPKQDNRNKLPTPVVLTAEAPDPFVVDSFIPESTEKSVHIVLC